MLYLLGNNISGFKKPRFYDKITISTTLVLSEPHSINYGEKIPSKKSINIKYKRFEFIWSIMESSSLFFLSTWGSEGFKTRSFLSISVVNDSTLVDKPIFSFISYFLFVLAQEKIINQVWQGISRETEGWTISSKDNRWTEQWWPNLCENLSETDRNFQVLKEQESWAKRAGLWINHVAGPWHLWFLKAKIVQDQTLLRRLKPSCRSRAHLKSEVYICGKVWVIKAMIWIHSGQSKTLGVDS